MRVLITAAGSHGDVLPFVALATELNARGHEAILFANAFFAPYARDAGIRFIPVGTADEYTALFEDPSGNDPLKAFKRISQELADLCPKYFHAMKNEVTPGATIAVGPSLEFAPRLLGEVFQIPVATVHLTPAVIRSNCAPVRLGPRAMPSATPAFLKTLMWSAFDRFFYDPCFTVPLNRFRAELSLPRVEHIFRDWIHGADLTLAMLPDWFADPQPDWPRGLKLTGFPLYDHGAQAPLPEQVQAFVDAGEPPVAFSAGTATATAHDFFKTSAEACRRAGRRGILLTHFPQQLPPSLPEGVAHFDYVLFAALLPKLAAFVHHGGIGATSQALRAGVPQLIRPVAYDQFDNSARAIKLGVARELLPRQYTPRAVARTLDALVTDRSIRERAKELAQRFKQGAGIAAACDAILTLARR